MSFDFLNYKPLIDSYLLKHPQQHSAYSFTNFFAWSDFFRFEICEWDNCLCVFAHNEIGVFQYLPPIGANVSRELIQKCFQYMNKVNKDKNYSRIEHVIETLNAFRLEHRAKEFVYLKQDVIDLKGNAYRTKRWSMNHFLKNNKSIFRKYQPSDLESCLNLFDQWSEHRKEKIKDDLYQMMIDENRQVHHKLLKNFDQLDVILRVVEIDQEIKGYTLGYPLTEDTFCVMLEITDLNIQGLSTYIFNQFCRDDCLKQYRFINAMDAEGMPNVEKAKESFRPDFFLESYSLFLN